MSSDSRALLARGWADAVSGASSVADLYDPATSSWSTTTLPPDAIAPAVGVGDKIYFSSFHAGTANVYDSAAGTWSTVGIPEGTDHLLNVSGKPLPVVVVPNHRGCRAALSNGALLVRELFDTGLSDNVVGTTVAFHRNAGLLFDTLSGASMRFRLPPLDYSSGNPLAIAIGSKLLFVENRGVAVPTHAWLYDTVTGRGHRLAVPDTVRIGSTRGASTTLGSKVLFQGATEIVNGSWSTQTLVVFDSATEQWSTVGTSSPGPDATAVGTQALFTGGVAEGQVGTDTVDVYSDESPAPVLAGGVAGRRHGRATVVLTNTGDADLSGPYAVQVYAAYPGRLKGAQLLGSAPIQTPLAPGESTTISVRIAVPVDAPAGEYHLVAMVVDQQGATTPFAGGIPRFEIRARATAPPQSATPISPRTSPIASTGSRRSVLKPDDDDAPLF